MACQNSENSEISNGKIINHFEMLDFEEEPYDDEENSSFSSTSTSNLTESNNKVKNSKTNFRINVCSLIKKSKISIDKSEHLLDEDETSNIDNPTNVESFKDNSINESLNDNPNNVKSFKDNSNDVESVKDNPNDLESFKDNPNNVSINDSPNNVESFKDDSNEVEPIKDSLNDVESFKDNPINLESLKDNQKNVESFIDNSSNLGSLKDNQNNLESFKDNLIDVESFKDNSKDVESFKDNPNNLESFKDNQNNLESFKDNPIDVESLRDNQDNLESFKDNPNNLESLKDNQNNIESVINNSSNLGSLKDNQNNVEPFEDNPNNLESLKDNQNNLEPFKDNLDNVKSLKDNSNDAKSFEGKTNNIEPFKQNPNKVELSEEIKSDPDEKNKMDESEILISYKGDEIRLPMSQLKYNKLSKFKNSKTGKKEKMSSPPETKEIKEEDNQISFNEKCKSASSLHQTLISVSSSLPKSKNQTKKPKSPCGGIELNKNALLQPLLNGWKREVVNRSITSKIRRDIYYYTPCGKKLRSSKEVEKYLIENNSNYTKENFSFKQISLGFDNKYESVRDSSIKGVKSPQKRQNPPPPLQRKNDDSPKERATNSLLKSEKFSPKRKHEEFLKRKTTTNKKSKRVGSTPSERGTSCKVNLDPSVILEKLSCSGEEKKLVEFEESFGDSSVIKLSTILGNDGKSLGTEEVQGRRLSNRKRKPKNYQFPYNLETKRKRPTSTQANKRKTLKDLFVDINEILSPTNCHKENILNDDEENKKKDVSQKPEIPLFQLTLNNEDEEEDNSEQKKKNAPQKSVSKIRVKSLSELCNTSSKESSPNETISNDNSYWHSSNFQNDNTDSGYTTTEYCEYIEKNSDSRVQNRVLQVPPNTIIALTNQAQNGLPNKQPILRILVPNGSAIQDVNGKHINNNLNNNNNNNNVYLLANNRKLVNTPLNLGTNGLSKNVTGNYMNSSVPISCHQVLIPQNPSINTISHNVPSSKEEILRSALKFNNPNADNSMATNCSIVTGNINVNCHPISNTSKESTQVPMMESPLIDKNTGCQLHSNSIVCPLSSISCMKTISPNDGININYNLNKFTTVRNSSPSYCIPGKTPSKFNNNSNYSLESTFGYQNVSERNKTNKRNSFATSEIRPTLTLTRYKVKPKRMRMTKVESRHLNVARVSSISQKEWTQINEEDVQGNGCQSSKTSQQLLNSSRVSL